MTTITINNGKLSKTNFENLSDLQDYLTLQLLEKTPAFSESFKVELDGREKELLSDKSKGASWRDIKTKLSSKNS
jgi:spore cortex formation protein SpoVR/YcgB (stage V sporulation)